MNLNEAYEAFTSDSTQRLWFDELKWQLTLLCRAAMHDVFNYQERRDLADDAVSHIFANLYKYDGKSLFSTWAFAVARNCARMELRRMRRERNSTNIESFGGEGLAQLKEELPQNLINQLSEKERLLLFAMLDSELSTDEAAVALKRPQRTVQWQWKRLKTKLLKLLRNRPHSSPSSPSTLGYGRKP